MVVLLSIILFYNNFRFPNIFILLFIPLFYGLLLLPTSYDYLSGLRSVVGYFTIALVPLVFYFMLKKYFDITIKFLKLTVIIYFLVGLIQVIFDRNFFSSILNRSSTTDSRGVTSLVAEPTFYGIVCLFLILIFVSLEIKNRKEYIYLLLFQIIFLSQSSMTILFLIIFCFYYFLFKSNFRMINIFVVLLAVISLVLFNIDFSSSNLRMLQLVNKFVENPSTIFILDASINDRVSAIYFSIKGFLDNYGIANGFGRYSSYLALEIPKQNIFWWVSESNRIMSFYGSVLFELGFVGFLIPIVYSTIIYKAYKYKVKEVLLYIFFINTILFSAIPLSFPFIGIYMATLIYKVKYETFNYSQ